MSWRAGLWPAGRLLHTPGIYDIKSVMLQVRKNEISLRKGSRSSAHLRILEGTHDHQGVGAI